MQLDDVVSSLTTGPRVGEAMERSVRWLDRCIEHHKNSGKVNTQNLFAIVQGGLDTELRDQCLDEMVKRKDGVAGYAIGGLSGGEAKGALYCLVPISVWLTNPRHILENVGFSLLFIISLLNPDSISQCAAKLPEDRTCTFFQGAAHSHLP